MYQKGIIHHLPLLIVGAVIIAVALAAIGIVKLPSIPFLQKKVKVELQETYKNPFKKETQFVNPFDSYKNPFVVSK